MIFYKNKKGFSLIELFFSLSILSILSILGFYYFNQGSKKDILEKERQNLIVILEEARSLSISSKNESEYGVFVFSDGAVLFEGDVYDPLGPNNKLFNFNTKIFASSVDLSLGDYVVFSRLTGESSVAGSVVLGLREDNSITKTINILSSGVIQ